MSELGKLVQQPNPTVAYEEIRELRNEIMRLKEENHALKIRARSCFNLRRPSNSSSYDPQMDGTRRNGKLKNHPSAISSSRSCPILPTIVTPFAETL